MRQRRPKNLEEKIRAYKDYMIKSPRTLSGNWRSVFNISEPLARKLFLEIGIGKGRFINELALNNKEDLFIGFEGQDTVIIRALEKIKENGLDNLMMCQFYINDFGELFVEDELDGIYLNFSDPWPKDRHEKRRLTSPRYLDGYSSSLKSGGFIRMKTDNDGLFDYSLSQFEKHREFDILELSTDLHSSKYREKNIMTEYEKKFFNFEKKIKYFCVIRK